MHPTTFPLTASGYDLQGRLEAGDLTSVDLVKAYLTQIHKHNRDGAKLNSLISVCPDDIAVAQAARLDQERRDGKIRSKLHGLPIVLKDAIVTDPGLGMMTTAGAPAFATMKATKNSAAAQKVMRLATFGFLSSFQRTDSRYIAYGCWDYHLRQGQHDGTCDALPVSLYID